MAGREGLRQILPLVSQAIIMLALIHPLAPAFAHTTLGNLNANTAFFRSNDHELNPTNSGAITAHVQGPLAHLWPGAGLNTYSGDSRLPPGYQSPFATFEAPLQAAFSSYSPMGAILTSTTQHDNVGDLIIGINFTQPAAFKTADNPNPTFRYGNLTIYIPAPVIDKHGKLEQDGFEPVTGIRWDVGETTNIVTTLTDSYANIFVSKAPSTDPFGPRWWQIYILSGGNGIEFTPSRNWSEWYYVRLNQVRAPDIAGRYLFKIFLGDSYPVRRQTQAALIQETMPMENWPVLLVKAEVDPAIITGTVRYGDIANSDLYQRPVKVPGRVRVVGAAVDPATGEATGRHVEARGYFNGSSEGHFEVEGVAPGIYDIYASAAGFPEQKVASRVAVRAGQSSLIDLLIKIGPQVKGEVFVKSLFGASTWRGQAPISIILYASNDYADRNIISYSPFNMTHAPYASYVQGGDTVFDLSRGGLAAGVRQKRVAFPWEGPVSYYAYTTAFPFRDPFGVHNGVGPAQVWWVGPNESFDVNTGLGSSGNSFRFQFGQKGFFGAPSLLSGMVPQVLATWIDGLEAGSYFVRVFVNGYVQTNFDGTQFLDYSFRIIPEESASDVIIPIDIRPSASINLTVHFHDLPGSSLSNPVGGPDPARFLIVELFDRARNKLVGLNFTSVARSSSSTSLLVTGLGMAGAIRSPDPRVGVKYSLSKYRLDDGAALRDYGIPIGLYTLRVYMRGYIQARWPGLVLGDLDISQDVSVTLGPSMISVSLHMFRGGGINVTLNSIDWQRPFVHRAWVWNNAPVSLLVYDVASRQFVDVIYFWNGSAWSLPRANSAFNVVPWPNWKLVFGASSSFLKTNGSTIVDRFGPDIPISRSLSPANSLRTRLFLQNVIQAGFLYSTSFYRESDFRSRIAIYPGVYAINGWTYGYMQEGVVSLGDLGRVQVGISRIGSQADLTVRLIVGLNFTVRILFKSEGIFTPISFNSSIRIRIYDDRDSIVAAASTSKEIGGVLLSDNVGFFADGRKIALSGGSTSPIPAGTMSVEYRFLAGLFGYVEPSAGGDAVRLATLFSPDHGVWGRSFHAGSYSGDWTVIVDMVNWYSPRAFYPPVPGLLQGESPSLFAFNHLGPFAMRQTIIIPNFQLGGQTTIIFEMDQRGYLQGLVGAFNLHGQLRTASWTRILFEGSNRPYLTYTWDGWYDAYLDPGSYRVKFIEWTEKGEGHLAQTAQIAVSTGQFVSGYNFWLTRSEKPIPEFQLGLIISCMVLAIGLPRVTRHQRLMRVPTD